MYRTRPPESFAIEARAIADPRPAAAMMLCPQPWPISGNASYSLMMQTVGPVPTSPEKPVEQSNAPNSTGTPKPFAVLVNNSEAKTSS